MKIGLQIPYYTYPGGPAAIAETFGRIVREAEAAGFDSVWVMDHFFQIGGWGPPEREMLEAYSALGLCRRADAPGHARRARDWRDLPASRAC